MDAEHKILVDGIAKFHDNERFSDCTILCGKHQLKVHKVIISAQSGFFDVALNETTTKGGKIDIFNLNDPKSTPRDTEGLNHPPDDPEMLKLMVDYFYRQEYPEVKDVLQYAKVFAMAVEYRVWGLRTLICARVRGVLLGPDQCWKHQNFAEAISFVYSLIPQVRDAIPLIELREALVEVIHQNGLLNDNKIKALFDKFFDLRDDLAGRKCYPDVLCIKHPNNDGFRSDDNCVCCGKEFWYCGTCDRDFEKCSVSHTGDQSIENCSACRVPNHTCSIAAMSDEDSED